jgi:peptidoglycan/xylan/chitin deacetylase (PgdA/CDA1 family)
MSILHTFLAASYHPLKALNYIGRATGLKQKTELRVLLYHDISLEEYSLFFSQMKWISKYWKFITPKDFELALSGEKELTGRNVLLTFDDGFFSNRKVAEEILKRLGIKAIFFIVTDFVGLKGKIKQKEFIAKNIYPAFTQDQVPDSWEPMDWNDVRFLLEEGHTIGAHTKSHARLSSISDLSLLKEEMINSKMNLEKMLNTKIEHFAYTFGDLNSFNQNSLQIAKQNYKYIYTGLRGNCYPGKPWAIRRDSFAPTNSISLIGSILEGGADLLYRKDLRTYESWKEV